MLCLRALGPPRCLEAAPARSSSRPAPPALLFLFTPRLPEEHWDLFGTPCFLLLPEREPAKRLANAGPKNTPVPFLLGWPASAALLVEFAGEGEFGGAALVAGSMVKPEDVRTSRVSSPAVFCPTICPTTNWLNRLAKLPWSGVFIA